ncbi:DegT/DnrJ/EryC1/StrS family aminotransferase [Desulforudis sp. 1088]|uniref:DegT/DnrJ/EryC1/StrS family aminotransferase n=1 Tax=unclassified Candidatus Desulforudis TaxID=2635950 RepID=UPI003CE5BE2E
MINVTKTFLPPFTEYQDRLQQIWREGWLTNNGPLVKELANELCKYLCVPRLELVANGTLALQLAIKALELTGEIVTTPFTYVATATAIVWEGCTSVFVDIDENTFCINPELIEKAITERTSAILATHVYGNPCDVEKIEKIAQKYNLKVIYDAAHCFGVKINGQSILLHGDVSTLSFHATKLFHTAEGGAVVCRDAKVSERVSLMKKFGHHGENDYFEVGINAKMSELHAAMGLCVLPKVDEIIARRRQCAEYYNEFLDGIGLRWPHIPAGVEYNYGYYPVVFPNHETMMRVREALIKNGIMPRRYFYPSLNTLPYLQQHSYVSCPVSENLASRILCLPMYDSLLKDDILKISKVIKDAIL